MNLRTELIAGATTFLTMCYILAVNPSILSTTGMDKGALFTATAIASAIATLLLAVMAKLPFAQAPSMGLNAFFRLHAVSNHGLFVARGISHHAGRRTYFSAHHLPQRARTHSQRHSAKPALRHLGRHRHVYCLHRTKECRNHRAQHCHLREFRQIHTDGHRGRHRHCVEWRAHGTQSEGRPISEHHPHHLGRHSFGRDTDSHRLVTHRHAPIHQPHLLSIRFLESLHPQNGHGGCVAPDGQHLRHRGHTRGTGL